MKKVVANKSNNNVVTVLQTDPTSTTTLEYFFGGLAVSSFIITWIASLLSPIVLFFALKRGYHFTSASIICITIIAYLPWDHGLISKYFQDFLNRYHPLYYSGGVSLVFEDGETPTTNSKQHRQTFYAVHPHGAFCIGWALLYHNPAMRGVRFCFAPALYASPFFRIFARMANKPGSAARPGTVYIC